MARVLFIKNWEKFQHFKDRRPPWVKLYRDILDDIDWHELDARSAKTLVMLWLIASENEGALPDSKKLAFRLRTSESDVQDAIIKLSHWLEHRDIGAISDRYQDDAPETETETETDFASQDDAKKSAQRKTPGPPKRASAMPEGFAPTDDHARLAKDLAVSLEAEFPSFVDFHRAKGSAFKDWDAALRNWLRNAKKFGKQSPPEANGSPFKGMI